MNIAGTIGKATLLATCIFWLLIFSEDFDINVIPFILLSLFPISICCALVIVFTIVPFYWFYNKKSDGNKIVFQWFFPFYSIASFSLCFYGFCKSPEAIPFFASAFFTSLQSWVWLSKKKNAQPGL